MNNAVHVSECASSQYTRNINRTLSRILQDLATALNINQVPGRNPFSRASWEAKAWPSRKSLSSWFADLLKRVEQLRRWSSTLVTPVSVWLPGLFNPMAFLTAIMQVVSRRTGLPLDKMVSARGINNAHLLL